jgi:hypothetical protein
LTKAIIEALTIGGGMPKDQVVNKLMSFGTYNIGVHYMAHHMNLAMQTLFVIPLVKHIESLLQTLHAYFAHIPKQHLEFTKTSTI